MTHTRQIKQQTGAVLRHAGRGAGAGGHVHRALRAVGGGGAPARGAVLLVCYVYLSVRLLVLWFSVCRGSIYLRMLLFFSSRSTLYIYWPRHALHPISTCIHKIKRAGVHRQGDPAAARRQQRQQGEGQGAGGPRLQPGEFKFKIVWSPLFCLVIDGYMGTRR